MYSNPGSLDCESSILPLPTEKRKNHREDVGMTQDWTNPSIVGKKVIDIVWWGLNLHFRHLLPSVWFFRHSI